MAATRIPVVLQPSEDEDADIEIDARRALDTRAMVSVWNSPAGGATAGGDWCEAVTLSDHVVALTVGDVSGHGAGVAHAMTTIRASILHAFKDLHVPSAVLSVANGLAENDGDGVLVTALVAYVDLRLLTLTFANAGHPPPLMLTVDDYTFLTQPVADLPLGIFARYDATDYVVPLPGDSLVVFYTDGITESKRDPVRGETELVEASRFVYARSEANAAHAIAQYVFRNGRGLDDAAAMVFRTPSTS